jgi:O-methyltransferase
VWSDYLDVSSWTGVKDTVRRVRMLSAVRANTVVSRSKLNTLYSLARRIESAGIDGIVAECGVFRGGSAALLAAATSPARQVFLFDSFQGLPAPGEKDGQQARSRYREGWCQGTAADVRAICRRLGVADSRVHMVEGWFQDTLPTFQAVPVALLHIDADWYESVRLCLETFYDRVSPGGCVVFDDYGRWEGCTRAVDEFLAARGLRDQLVDGHYLVRPTERGVREDPPRCV